MIHINPIMVEKANDSESEDSWGVDQEQEDEFLQECFELEEMKQVE